MREIKFRVYDKDLAKYLEGCEKICPARYIFEQYTGLKDKNGKKIYENDIIKDTSDGDCLINAVFWCEKGGFWGVKPRNYISIRVPIEVAHRAFGNDPSEVIEGEVVDDDRY